MKPNKKASQVSGFDVFKSGNKFLIKKDHRIYIPSFNPALTVDITFKAGEEVEVPERFIPTLKAEGAI